MFKYLSSILLFGVSTNALGASLNFYQSVFVGLGMDSATAEVWGATLSGLLTLLIILFLGLKYKKAVESNPDEIIPDGKFSIRSVIDSVMDFVSDLVKDIVGPRYLEYMPLLAGTFLFILISNLCGMVPGFAPTTVSINTNLAMGISIFLYYTWAGIKEHGAGYINQFLGPVLWLAPLFVIIELVAHLARPVSLSLRLMGNIFGDHLVLSVFNELTYGIIAPAMFMFFGLMVACLQSFIFTLLSSIYISLAISHDH